LLKTGVAPGSLVMAPRRVEHSSLAPCPYPRPRLLVVFLDAVLQNGAILFVVPGVDIGFIPALEPAIAFHDGMIGGSNGGAKDTGAVAKELRSDQLDILR